MNPNRIISFPNGSTALSLGARVGLSTQNGLIVTVPAGTSLQAIGTVVRDVAAGAAPVQGTVANGLGQYSTSDVFSPGALLFGIADGPITAGVAVYAQINGMITATNTGTQIGIAIQTAGQLGDVIEFVTGPLI